MSMLYPWFYVDRNTTHLFLRVEYLPERSPFSIKYTIFPVIAIKPPYPPYLSALLPQDQIFDPEDLDFDPKSQILQQQKEHKEAQNIKKEKEEDASQGEEVENTPNENIKNEENNQSSTFIDNPYLAATKMPAKEQTIDVLS